MACAGCGKKAKGVRVGNAMTSAPPDPQSVVYEFFRDRLVADLTRNGLWFHQSAERVVSFITDEEIQAILDSDKIPKLESFTGFYQWAKDNAVEFASAVEEASLVLGNFGHTKT